MSVRFSLCGVVESRTFIDLPPFFTVKYLQQVSTFSGREILIQFIKNWLLLFAASSPVYAISSSHEVLTLLGAYAGYQVLKIGHRHVRGHL